MAPHGSGLIGASHSHNPEYPDDSWNLYSMLDREGTTALNVTIPENTKEIFKPHVHRLDLLPEIVSDADEEIIVIIKFTSPVHIRKFMVIGSGLADKSQYPNKMKVYVNRGDDVDFNNISSYNPTQEFNLVADENGTIELFTIPQQFTNITTLSLYFPTNIGGHPHTILRYIGMQGDHTHYRREPVHTTYEVLCNGSDIIQPEGAFSNVDHDHSHGHSHGHDGSHSHSH